MRKLAALLLFTCACTDDPTADENGGTEATESGDGDGDGDATGDGDGDATGDGDGDLTGDGDGDDGPVIPADLPTPTGNCPDFASGNVEFAPAGTETRSVKLWVGDNPTPGGMLIMYWHGYGSAPDEAVYTLSNTIIDAITAAGGVVAAPYPASDVGQFPWFAVAGSPREDDMLLADEIVGCAIEQIAIDPSRIHSTGMSAGGLQTTALAMRRSRYIAAVTTYSGGTLYDQEFEDPESRFAAMIIHGGETDIFGGFVHFDQASETWRAQLEDNGNFAFVCDHGNGHTVPTGLGGGVVNFFYAHPFGTAPSPYAAGLPDDLPEYCSL